MRFIIDGVPYDLNLTRVGQHLQVWYEQNKYALDKIELESGKSIDFSRKSVARIALKTAIMPVVLGSLKMVYKMRGAELPKHIKHEDFIDYAIHNALGILALFDREGLYVETLERPESHGRIVDSVSTQPTRAIPERTIAAGVVHGTGEVFSTTVEEADSDTRGEALLRGRQNGHGENQAYQGDYTQEAFGTTQPERIPPGHEEEG